MGRFTIASSVLVDGNSVRSNSQIIEVESFLDYSKEVSTTYLELVDNTDQPSECLQVVLSNTGAETAIIRQSANGTDFYFTALPSGATMVCPLRNTSGSFVLYAARGESADTTIRVIALYF